MKEKQENKTPQHLKWTTVQSINSYIEARAKADAVKGKVRRRPDGRFEVRVGTEVKTAKAVEENASADG